MGRDAVVLVARSVVPDLHRQQLRQQRRARPEGEVRGQLQQHLGSNDYRDAIKGPATGGNTVCDVKVGDVIDTNTGNNAGPTSQGVDGRITTWDPINAIVTFAANGQVTVLNFPDSPQLIMVPMVENPTAAPADLQHHPAHRVADPPTRPRSRISRHPQVPHGACR